jgi:hypothetical protein
LLLTLALIGAGFVSEAAPARRAGAEAPLVLRARSPADVAALEVVLANPGTVTQRRLDVSDLVVRLRPDGEGRLASVLALADGERAGRGRVLFTAELLVVVAGRLLIEERAACGAWSAGTSICRSECDGGAFAILRTGGARALSLRLRLGEVDPAEPPGVRLGACREGDADEATLAPRRGERHVEIGLRAD